MVRSRLLSVVLRIAAPVVGVGLIASLVLIFAPTPSANAWSGPSRIVSSRSAPLDWCPGNADICQDQYGLATLAANTPVTMVCWIDARHMSGFTYNRWFYVTSGSLQGFVKDELVTNQNPSSPWCYNRSYQPLRAVMAALFNTGLSEIHQVYPTAQDKTNALNVYGFNSWGYYGDWSGDCVMFTALGWWNAGKTMLGAPTAYQISQRYQSAGLLHTTGVAPRGAAVFWRSNNTSGTPGHVAMSLGNSRIVTTYGLDNARIATSQNWVSYFSGMTYVGWVATP